MKKTNFFPCFIIAVIFLLSCGQTVKDGNPAADAEDESLTDSAKFENYFEWTRGVEYIKSNYGDTKALSENEKNRDPAFLHEFWGNHQKLLRRSDEFEFDSADYLKYLFQIDINGDGLDEIIYNGPAGGEASVTRIFYNQGDGFKEVFSVNQYVRKMGFREGKLVSIDILNPGCCADPQILEYFYSVSWNKTVPEFKLERTTGYLNQTEKAPATFPKTLEFSVKSGLANLRTDCYFLDVEHPYFGVNGNVIAAYEKGDRGKVLGSKKDKDNEWVYVLMKSKRNLKKCDFPDLSQQSAEIYGWMLKADTDLN